MVKSGEKKICSDKRPPHFYKIIHPGLPTHCLRIPLAFVKHIAEEKSERAILEGPSGDHWHVKLCKTTDDIFLQDGWEEFLRDHSLWNNEFLIFRYDGNMCFNVQIFDKSGCERTNDFTIKKHEGSDFSNGGMEQTRPLKKFVSSSGKKRGRPSKKFVSYSGKKWGRPPKQFTGSTQLSQSKTSNKDPGKVAVAQKRIKIEDVGQPIGEMNSQAAGYLSSGQPATKAEIEKVWRAAKSFTSNLPYFLRRLNRSSVYFSYILTIPSDFAKAHLPRIKAEVTLRNLEGKTWIVNFVPGKTHAFCGGWTAFARANKLEEGDICIFELVREFEMCVHIFRLVKQVEPSLYDDW